MRDKQFPKGDSPLTRRIGTNVVAYLDPAGDRSNIAITYLPVSAGETISYELGGKFLFFRTQV